MTVLRQLVPTRYPAQWAPYVWEGPRSYVFSGCRAVVNHFLPCARGDALCWALAAEAVSAVILYPGENLPLMTEGVSRIVRAEQVPGASSVVFSEGRSRVHTAWHVQAIVVIAEKE